MYSLWLRYVSQVLKSWGCCHRGREFTPFGQGKSERGDCFKWSILTSGLLTCNWRTRHRYYGFYFALFVYCNQFGNELSLPLQLKSTWAISHRSFFLFCKRHCQVFKVALLTAYRIRTRPSSYRTSASMFASWPFRGSSVRASILLSRLCLELSLTQFVTSCLLISWLKMLLFLTVQPVAIW